jgi:hypothetical protein
MSTYDKAKLNNVSGVNTGDQTIKLTGDVTGQGTGTFATTISNGVVDNAKLADNSVSGGKIEMGSDASGDMLYYDGTNYSRVPIGTNGQFLQVNATVPTWTTRHFVGESYGGGIIFYVDATGQHGLIASAGDASSAQGWSNVTTALIGATAQSLTDGPSNCVAITTQGGHITSAAQVCFDYSIIMGGTTYDDWFLPALHQLNLLFNQAYAVGGFTGTNYWSSTESGANVAWRMAFNSGTTGSTAKTATYRVRCIRSF